MVVWFMSVSVCGWVVCRSLINFLEAREVTLPCSYWSTFEFYFFIFSTVIESVTHLSLLVGWSFGKLVGWFVGPSVCHNFLKEKESYTSTFFYIDMPGFKRF